MAALAANSPWEEIIGDRTADKMKAETVVKFHKDKKSTNTYKRLVHINGLFAGGNDDQKGNDDADPSDDEPKKHEDHFWKPVTDVLDVTNQFAQLTKSEPTKLVEHGVWAISAEAEVTTKCNFSVKDSGKWYYEIEVGADPESHDGLNIGFANTNWGGRGDVGHDANSYGLQSADGRVYNVQSSYGSTNWKGGDVLGVMLDHNEENCKMEFSLNGESQGVAFEYVDCAGNMFAAITIGQGGEGVFKWKSDEVSHRPDGYSCIEMADDAKLEDVFEITGPLKVEEVDGDIKMSAAAGREFPSAVLKGCPLAKGTKWYFEFVFGGDSDKILAQIGFADEKFKAISERGQGVGDDAHSWGCDLMRLKKWGSSGIPYAADLALKPKDIVGCTLDLDSKTISYSVNGKDLGVAFEGVEDSDGLYPAISVKNGAVREQMINLYQSKVEDKQWPDAVHIYTFCLAENAMKHRPNGSRLFTECTVFKAMAICEGLKEYSFLQYKEDYAFMDTVIMLSKDEEFDTVLDSVDEDTLVVCDFWATWCGPCVYVAPLYHAISEEFRNVVFLKADVDKLKALSQKEGIEAMPTFKFYKNKKEIHMVRGADAAKIKDAVQKFS